MGKKLDLFLNAISKDIKFILTSMLSVNLWKLILILLIAISAIFLVAIFIIGGLIFGISTMATGGGQSAIIPAMAIGILITALVFFALMFFIAPIIHGLLYNSVADFINKGTFSLKESFEKTKKRYLKILGVNLLLIVVGIILYAALALLMFIPVLGWIIFFLIMILMIPLTIILWPFVVLISPVAVLSQESIIGVFKRVIKLGKMNFMSNLGYLIALWVVSMVIGFIAQIIIVVAIVIIAALFYVHYIVGIIAAVVIGVPVFFAYTALVMLLETLFITKIYLNNERDSKLPPRV